MTTDTNLLDHFSFPPRHWVFWTFRYFLGRQSISASQFARDILTCKGLLTEDREQMKHEAKRHLEIFDIRPDSYTYEIWNPIATMEVE